MNSSLSYAKILGFVGIIISIVSLMATIYLYLRQATLMSLTRDIAGAAIDRSDKQSMMEWINTLASSWSHSLMPIPILATILLLYSTILLELSKCKTSQN
jgi:flagellar biosynthesis protein FlhB